MSEQITTSPTDIIPLQNEDWSESQYYKSADEIDFDNKFGIEIRSDGAEFTVGDVRYSYLGKTNNGYSEFTSVGPDNVERAFVVYMSRSEGSYRSSQGLEEYRDGDVTKTRLLKGAELSPLKQYTQDTQLNPEFEVKMDRLSEIRQLRDIPVRKTPLYDNEGVNWYVKDFEAQVKVYPLGSNELDAQLKELKAGYQSSDDIREITGFDPNTEPEMAKAAYMEKIHALNTTIEKTGIMPDFSKEPKWIQITEHPVLGNMVRETFEKTANGVVYEWQMARDTNGRTWIERIRFADANSTAYGTDRELVYSGLLTAKPMDYDAQADGLPKHFVKDMGNGYTDVSMFLKKLAPIREYDKYLMSRDRYYHFGTAA